MVPTFNPPGDYYDTPFHWIFDASGLTDGANAQNLSLYIQAGFGDFWLRRIVGMASVVNPTTGQFQIRDASLNYIESDPMFISPASDDQAVIPEIEYPEKNAIRFDLYDVLRVDPPITGNYSQTQVLEQTDGTSLAIDGNLMVVGDLTAENGGLQTGAAYLYKLTAGVWSLIATLTGIRRCRRQPVRSLCCNLAVRLRNSGRSPGSIPYRRQSLCVQSSRRRAANHHGANINFSFRPGDCRERYGRPYRSTKRDN